MKNKKHIDKFFGEDFKNLEAEPSPRVWENIQKELNKDKRERKVIPLWLKYGGIAALLALLFTVGNFVYNPSEVHQDSITTDTNINHDKKIQDKNIHSQDSDVKETRVVTGNMDKASESIEEVSVSETTPIKNNGHTESKKLKAESSIATTGSKNYAIPESKIPDPFTNKNGDNPVKSEKGIAINQQTEDLYDKGNGVDGKTKNQIINSDIIIAPEAEEGIAIIENPEKTEIDSIGKDVDSKNKKSILDAIAENKTEEDNSIKTDQSKPENRWVVTPNVAPVYYSSLKNGSSIAEDFTNNPQKGDVNMSYGLQVSYALSERLSIRSGIHNMDLSYSTSDIVIGTGPVSAALKSVDYGSRQIVVTAVSRQSLNNNQNANSFGDITLKSTSGDAKLIQSINYYEIPVELKYAIIDSKFGINVIGGVSTLFLGNNEISVKSDNFSSVLGEANNLSNVSFSTNVGLGLDYKLSKRFAFNVEPMFKYQLNPYTDSNVNFKPYYLGVYSGLSFKF